MFTYESRADLMLQQVVREAAMMTAVLQVQIRGIQLLDISCKCGVGLDGFNAPTNVSNTTSNVEVTNVR